MKLSKMTFLKHFEKKSVSSIFVLFTSLTLFFLISFGIMFKPNYTNNSGTHCWLSGSTIKFVNNWLDESPLKLHFVNYESPNSIEFNNLEERGPYVSYPTGETFFVYSAARIIGKKSIGIYFLKHFQMLCFWLEMLFISLFVYRFLSRNGIRSEFEKTVVSFLTASYWILLPINVWYLANVYFADQCVILFVMAFLLIEYESLYCEKKKYQHILNFLKFFLVFSGVLIDYYFWILVFISFCLEISFNIKNRKPRNEVFKVALWYVIPVLLALLFFAYQLFSIPKWNEILKNTFLFRTGFSENQYNRTDVINYGLKINFLTAFGLKNFKFLFWILIVIFLYIDYNFEERKVILTKNKIIVLLGVISPLIQVILLKNHSSIHEFSMIKFGWCFAMLPIVSALFIVKLVNNLKVTQSFQHINFSLFFHVFLILFLFMALITGVPGSSRKYYISRRGSPNDYHLSEILREYTKYEHVCFSFSHEILPNPPQELAVSKKRIYKISTIDEMKSKFPLLKSEAKKVLVIDKNDTSVTAEQKSVQLSLISKNKSIYEDERYCLLEIINFDTSVEDGLDYLFE